MTVYQLLTVLGEAGIKLWVEAGELRFRAPKGVLTPALREAISAEKSALISFLQQSRSGEVVKKRRIQPVSRISPLPLSFGQERLWFLSQLEPDSSAYYIPILLDLEGALDQHKLKAALNALIDRHEVLRTCIRVAEGHVQVSGAGAVEQHILSSLPSPWLYEDLTGFSESSRQQRLQQIIEQTRSLPFDLSQGPLLRMALIKLGDQRHQLMFNLHHIIADGWSMGVLVKELLSLYMAQFRSDVALDQVLPPLAIQYGDYAHWQRQWLQGNEPAQQLTYWQQQLLDAPVLELPLDKARPAALRPRGNAHFFQWPLELLEQARVFSQQQGVTLFMTLLAAFEVLLSRYSAQDDFVIGTPVANRTMPEQEPLIGFFVNTLALRARLDHTQSFEAWVKQVQQTTLEAYANQDLPFEHVVEALHLPREMSYTPVFQVMFSVQSESDIHINLPMLTISALPLTRRTSKFDLNLTFSETPQGLCGELEYNTDLFFESTVTRMETQLRQLLTQGLTRPSDALNRVPMMSADECQKVLCEWNPAPSVVSSKEAGNYGIAALFEAQVAQQPDAPALLQGGWRLSYAELNRQANQCAQAMVKAGVKPDQVVVLCGQRSAARLIALLAIVKAGAVYLPLETDLPAERLNKMITQGQAQWALVEADQGEVFQRLPLTLLPYPDPDLSCADEACANLNLPAGPEQRSYIMFTSGSTGEPKGIVIPQRGIIRLVKDNGFLPLGPDTHLLHYAPLSFDASTFEIWGALLNGGCLVIASPGLLELEQLAAEIEQNGVNTLWLTAALFHAMAEHCPQAFAPLTTLLAGGDQLNPHLVKRVLYRYPHLTLINGYGPTENTTFTCCQVLTHADQVGRSVAIGKPIAGTQVYVLNETLQPQAMGVPGELCTAGEGVALGYLPLNETVKGGSDNAGNKTDKTAKFIANPFANLPGHGPVLYRTGDKARYLADGSLEFLGRLDQQVKLRGYRIELGEIETTLTRLPWIQNNVVTVQTHAGQKYLVAYIEVDGAADLAEGEYDALIQRTRKQLAQQLPDYMQPTAYKILATLPMTRNGKVDRAALPSVTFSSSKTSDNVPRTSLEAELLSIWQAVLKVDDMGIHDNFFELGGHSLLATQVTSRIRKKLRYELPVRQLFAAPTIAECARWLEDHGQQSSYLIQAEIQPRKAGTPLPLTYAQRRLWLLEQLSPGSSAYIIPSALRIHGVLDIACVNQVVNTLIARHESLRTAIVREETGEDVLLRQQVLPSCVLNVAYEAYNGPLTPEALQALIDAEACRPFDLTQAPLFRLRLLALDSKTRTTEQSQDSLLLLTMHHIISDGWSMTVFVKEFTELYEAFRAGHANPLAPLTLQYGDYALWQQRWLDEKHLQTALDFWVAQIGGNDPVLHLPTDLPRPMNPSSPGALLTRTLPLDLSQALVALSEREGVSLFMLALSSWQLLLSRYSGQQRFNVGSPVAGRTVAETEALIGFFINTVVFSAQVEPALSFREFLYRLREQSLAAYEHQALPFEMLVDRLQPERSLSHSPLFQVFLNVLNLPSASRDLPDLRIEDLTGEQQNYSAKFDLTLYVQPQDEGIKLSMLYRSDCFTEQSIVKHLAQLETLLEQVVADLDRPLSAFHLLQADDKSVLPDPLCPLAEKEFILPQQQIAAQARRQGDKSAIVDLDGHWSYRELEQWSNQLAFALQAAGVAAEDPVVIYGHRSGALVCALLGIIKAGAAFVVLDPAYPEARLLAAITQVKPQAALILERGESLPPQLASVLFGQIAYGSEGESRAIIRHSFKLPALLGWRSQHAFVDLPTQEPVTKTGQLDQLSYLMLTSGTTGQAKVIRGSLRPLAALLDWYPRSFDVNEQDRFTLFSGLAHDPLLRDILVPLSLGACIYIPDPDLLRKPGPFRQWMIDNAVSVSHMTPALAQLISLDSEKSPPCSSLRRLIFSGDKLLSHKLDAMRHFAPTATVINCYGCTETPQIHSWQMISADSQGLLPVGQGTQYSQLLLLTTQQRQAGIGEVAEIYIRSPYLALGYTDADLSQSVFIANPLDPNDKARLYRTGDFGRYLAKGSVQVLGRHDHQVKVRGYRIELEDVVVQIKNIVHLEHVLVCLRPGEQNDEALVAYLVASAVDSAALREQLRLRLPEYMIPAEFFVVTHIPLNPNGKVDMRALHALAVRQERTIKAPETNTEIALAALWAEVLRRPIVGVNENFFELGGHSLLATQLVMRVKNHFKVDLPLKMLFELSTVESMAQYIDAALWVREERRPEPSQENEGQWEELEL